MLGVGGYTHTLGGTRARIKTHMRYCVHSERLPPQVGFLTFVLAQSMLQERGFKRPFLVSTLPA